jgi:cobalt-zinc-cadmium efflux system membrane fusion protein
MLFRFIKISVYSIVFAGSIIYLSSCSPKNNTPADDGRGAYEIPDSLLGTLAIDTVKMANLTNSIKFNGVVDFNTDKVANIFPLISGNVQDIKAELGDHVSAGQVLGIIKSSEVANYNAALINAETNVKLNASLLAKQEEMAKSGLASQVDVTTAKVNYEQAQAAQTAAEKILSINGNNMNGEYVIKSPIDGFVVQKNITNGMAIRSDNSTNLFTISDLKEVWVQANVYEANINNVHEGDSVDVTTITDPDKIYKGKIDKLMNVLDPTNRVMKMRIVLPNPDYKLKPQMFATVTVNNDLDRQAIAVPFSALVFDHSQYYVLVYHSRKDVQIRSVDVLSTNNKTAYIKSGVTPGEVVIASQAILIYGALNN